MSRRWPTGMSQARSKTGKKRGVMFRSVWLALVFSTAAAAASVDLPKLRHLSEAQPAQALADGDRKSVV